VLMFSIYSLLNVLYISKDTAFFFALPVKHSTVFLAKLTVIYISELVIAAAFLFPALLALGITAGVPFTFYLFIPLGILLAPSIPLLLAAILAIPIMYIATLFKGKGAVTSVAVLILFAALFTGYYFLTMQFGRIAGGIEGLNPDELAAVLENVYAGLRVAANVFYPLLALARLSTLTTVFGLNAAASFFVNFALSFGVIAALIVVAFFISKFIYAKGAQANLEHSKKSSKSNQTYKGSNTITALMGREFKQLIRTPSFAFNCLINIILTPVTVLIMLLTMPNMGGEAAEEFVMPLWQVIFGLVIMMGVGMNLSASTAITREGKSFKMLKMLPVSAETQLNAKIIVYTIISVIAIIPSIIMVMIFEPNWINFAFSIPIAILFAYGFNCFAVLWDLRKPKLDWTTPNEAVKQNFNIIIPMFIFMGLAGILIGTGVALFVLLGFIGDIIAWSVFLALGLAAAIIFHLVLKNHSQTLWNRLPN